MRRLLISTTALSVALSPFATLPVFAQTVAEDGSIIGPDGTVICVPTDEAACDLDAIMAAMAAAEAEAAAQAEAEAAAQAEAEAAAQAEAEAAAQAEAEAAAQAEAEAAAQAEAEAAAQAEAEAAAQAEAEAAAQAEAEAAAQAEAEAAAQAEAEAAAQAEAEAAAQAEAEAAAQAAAEAEAAAQAEADAAAQAAAEAEAAAQEAAQAAEEAAAQEDAEAAAAAEAAAIAAEEAAAQAAAEAAAAAEAEAAAAEEAAAAAAAAEEATTEEAITEEATTEEATTEDATTEEATDETATEETDPVADAQLLEAPVIVEEPFVDTAPIEEPVFVEEVVDPATGALIDPEVAAAALAEAQKELVISDEGKIVDPAAGLVVAEPETLELAEPVDAPAVTEGEVESLSQLLTIDPTVIDPSAIAAAALVPTEPAAEGGLLLPEPDPASLIAAVTETIDPSTMRASDEEFAAPPVEVSGGKKNKLSNLEKAGLVVLGALVVGAIIKSNNDKKEEERRVVSNTGDRVIILRPDGTYEVLKDDDTIIRTPGSTVTTETFRDGSTRTIVKRQDGTQVVTIRDATGRVLRRATYDHLGREIILIDDLAEEEVVVIHDLPKPKKKIVISSKDDDAAIKRELARLEAEKAGRKFSLRQIREIPEVRALAATIDVEPITFASGSAAVTTEEVRNLADLGQVMQDLLEENPNEVFLVMGHTDATGKAAMNLALSDRRAESVALALTEYFDIPPENMVVQGYGETELLIDTQEDEPLNRRVEVKVITPLMRTAELR